LKQWPSLFKLLNTFIGDVGAALKPNLRLVSNYENENREEADSMQFSAKKKYLHQKIIDRKRSAVQTTNLFLPYFNRLTCFFHIRHIHPSLILNCTAKRRHLD
jgi:hypothetical protein